MVVTQLNLQRVVLHFKCILSHIGSQSFWLLGKLELHPILPDNSINEDLSTCVSFSLGHVTST